MFGFAGHIQKPALSERANERESSESERKPTGPQLKHHATLPNDKHVTLASFFEQIIL